MNVEKTHAGTPIGPTTRPEEVPEFLSCGHNAHWQIWDSVAKGEPCLICRAEKAELAVIEMLQAIENSPVEKDGFRSMMVAPEKLEGWKAVISGEWQRGKHKCKMGLKTLVDIEMALRYAPEFVALRIEKHVTNEQIGEIFRLAMERIEQIRVAQ